MNVLNKFIFFLILLLNLSLVSSFNVCNVDIDEPWFKVNDSSGNDVLIVDNEGDIYFEGTDHILNNVNSQESFEVGSGFFNIITSSFNSFSQDLGILPASINSLIVKSDLGTDISSFDENGNIYTLGQGVYEDSQAGCLADGGYCNGNIIENRDYYCDITGSKTGNCDYSLISSEDCNTKASIDTDGGNDIYTQGTVTDYITCSLGSCTFNSYTDYCQDISNLVEYSPSGSFYNSQTVPSSVPNYRYCTADKKFYHQVLYTCLSGAFQFQSDIIIDSCLVPSPDYTSWSCISNTQRRRTVTTYYPECSTAGGCSQSSVDSFQTETAPSGYLCGAGNWVLAPKVISISASPWSVNLPGIKSVNVCMASSGANSCSWCGTSQPCNGCTNHLSSGNHQYTDCAAVASNSYSQSDVKYGSSSCSCIATQKSSCHFNGLTGATGIGPTLDQCYDYNWVGTGSYGACSVSCGGGIQYEDFICQRSDGVTVSDSKCSGSAPTVTQICNTQSCCTDECTLGPSSCSGDNIISCGYFDADSCLDKKTTTCLNACSGGSCVECNTVTDCIYQICSGPCNRCVSHTCFHGDNGDSTPEELEFYSKLIKENKYLINEGKVIKSLH